MDQNLFNISTNASFNSTSNYYTRYKEIVYTLVIVSLCSILTNLLTVVVFWSSRRKSIHILLIGEALFEIIARSCSIVWHVDYLFRINGNILVWAGSYYATGVATIARNALVWTIVAINLERYFAVCRPFQALTVCSITKSRLCLIIISILSVVFNVCRFWDCKIISGKIVRFLMRNPIYIEFYRLWLTFVFKFVLPFVVLVIVNIFIVTTLCRRKQFSKMSAHQENRFDRKTSIIIVIFTFIFLLFNFPPFFHHFVEASCFRWKLKLCKTVKLYQLLISHLANLMITIHGCTTFFIYFICSRSFRSRFRGMFSRF